MPFKIYKGDEVVTEGESPLEITGLSPNTDVAAGEYQAVRVEDDRESERVDIPAFKTLGIDSRDRLVSAINNASAGDTIKLTSGFSIDSNVIITKDITIDGGGYTVTSETDDIALFAINEGDSSFSNIDIELSGENSRAFLLNDDAGDFNIKDAVITGETPNTIDGQRGISSSHDYSGVVTIDSVEFNNLRTGVYTINDHDLSVNDSTFDSNYRAMTIEGNEVPTLTNNVFTGNDKDISASYDSEIRSDIAEEAENPNNNNTFDGKPKYNWSVTSVSLSPKTSTAESGTAGDRDLTATVEPEHALNKTVTFSTEDVGGLSVSSSGKLEWTDDTPAGEYTTTVTTADGDYTDTHVLTLTEPEPEPDPEEPGDGEEGE